MRNKNNFKCDRLLVVLCDFRPIYPSSSAPSKWDFQSHEAEILWAQEQGEEEVRPSPVHCNLPRFSGGAEKSQKVSKIEK